MARNPRSVETAPPCQGPALPLPPQSGGIPRRTRTTSLPTASFATLAKKGVIEQLYTAPPVGSVVVCLDEMGPQAAKSFPGQQLVKPAAPEAERAKQEIDYGRRGSGYVFGAFQPASGTAFTHPYDRRTTTNWVDFLGEVEAWIDPAVERIYAIRATAKIT